MPLLSNKNSPNLGRSQLMEEWIKKTPRKESNGASDKFEYGKES
jgi:hypothetical protein